MDESDDEKTLLPMRAVARMTGLAADTIRVWERRYEAVQPLRTEGNARRYSPQQVERLKQLKQATERGFAIREIAALSDAALQALVPGRQAQAPDSYGPLIESYLEAINRFDVRQAGEILARTAAIIPNIEFALQIVVPLMREVGARWLDGRIQIAHEHLVTTQLRNLLGSMIRQASLPSGVERIVVGTPPLHLHEFGALVGAFIAVSRGIEPIFLGTNVPADQLALAARRTGARVILLSVVRDLTPNEHSELVPQLRELGERFHVWIGAPSDHALGANSEGGIRVFHRYEELDRALRQELRPR